MTPLVEFVGVSRVYGQVVAVDDLSLRVSPGEMAFLVGPSGAGKSTLLRLINREVRPSHGEVWVDGLPCHDLPVTRLAELRRRVGVVFQDFKLLPRLTALENVAFALHVTDEPTGNLDQETAWQITGLLEDIAKFGTAVLVATHNMEIVARAQRRVLSLASGRLVDDVPAGRAARMLWATS